MQLTLRNCPFFVRRVCEQMAAGWGGWCYRAMTPADRWLTIGSLAGILWLLSGPTREGPGSEVLIVMENQLQRRMPLTRTTQVEVMGRLGPVVVEVGRNERGHPAARLLEQASPRRIGVRTGWIAYRGQMAACLPCGVFIQIGSSESDRASGADGGGYDAMTR